MCACACVCQLGDGRDLKVMWGPGFAGYYCNCRKVQDFAFEAGTHRYCPLCPCLSVSPAVFLSHFSAKGGYY